MNKATGKWILGLCCAIIGLFSGCEQRNTTPPAVRQESPKIAGTIVAVGDSLTAGLGVNEAEAYPARLEQKLRSSGYPWKVINAGISGETSSGTLSRVNWVLKLHPDIVMLETGANDGLRGIDPKVTRRNMDETIRILQENKVIVVLVGMRMTGNLGREYTDAFAANYPALARKHNLILVPFFFERRGWRAVLEPE